MKWKNPPIIKIYEALGCLADNRLEEINDEIKVYSSSRQKFYNVKYNREDNAIMANDNGSFYLEYLGYPSIAYLMKIGEIPFNAEYSQALKDIPWKDLNVEYKNDFTKTIIEVNKLIKKRGVDLKNFKKYMKVTLATIEKKGLIFLQPKQSPPKGY